MPTLMEIMQDEELGAAARAEADAIFGDVVNVYQTQQAPIVTDFVQDDLGNYQRRDVHGEGEYRFSPVQLERAMRAKTGQSSIRENIFDYLLKTTGNPSYATTGAVGADFTPVLGTAIGLEDAYYSGADIPEDLREGNYIGAAKKGGQVALELGTALLGAIPTGRALGGLIDTVAPTARADIAGLGRGIMQADPSMVGEVFQRGGTPQSLSSANVEIIPSVLGRQDVKMYSPSLRAAEGLKQEKGTYEQLRKMMLNEGAKADELNWSGADAEFGGKKVTKQALVDYLSENTDMIEEGLLESSGKLGGEAKSADEMVNEFVENSIDNEIEYYRTDYGPDAARDSGDYFSIENLDEEQIEEAAAALGYESSDEFIEKAYYDWVYVSKEGGEWKQFADEDEIVLDYFGGEDKLRNAAEESLRDNAQYEADRDPAGFFEQYLGGDADDYYDQQFGEGDTEYSQYFTEGAEDYNEKLYQFVDPTGKIDQSALARGSHFDDYSQGLIAHARTGRFRSTTGDDVRLVGEIQSDVAQEARKAGSNFQTREEMIAGSELEREVAKINDEYNRKGMGALQQLQELPPADIDAINQNIAMKGYTRLREEGLIDLAGQSSAQSKNGIISLPDNFNEWPEVEQDEYFKYVQGDLPFAQPFTLSQIGLGNGNNLNKLLRLRKAGTLDVNLPSLNKILAEYDGLEEVRVAAIKKLEPLSNLSRREPDGVETVESANLTEGAPFVDSTNKWVDMALRRNLFDAIREGSDVMAVPNSDMVRAMTYGTEKGQGEFYDRIVPKRFQDVVRRIDKNAKLEPMQIDTPDGNKSVAGLRLSDEFIANVAKKGIPTFLAAGAVPMTGFMDYLQGQKQEEQRQMNNLLGYGGFM